MQVRGQSYLKISILKITSVASQDYQHFGPVGTSESGATSVTFVTWDDETTLEYDDSVNFIFTPHNPPLIYGIEDAGEFIRDTATVNIIDTDS